MDGIRVLKYDFLDMMLTKNLAKTIQSLKIKKYRREHGLFMIEGSKLIEEALKEKWDIEYLLHTKDYSPSIPKGGRIIESIELQQRELESLGTLSSNKDAIGILKVKKSKELDLESWMLYMDEINDPGNVGTILRTADWFGIKSVILSPGTADHLNPKTIMSSKGSIFRLNIQVMGINELRTLIPQGEIIGADLKGISLSDFEWPRMPGLIILGSESHGLSSDSEKLLTKKVKIEGIGATESLNVAQAAGIILYDLQIRKLAT